MIIKSNKSFNNINDESLNSLKDFRQKQISTNIKYHITFIILLIIINIGLIVFIIFYKNKIKSIKSKNNTYHSQLDSQDQSLANANNILTHKLVNIAALNQYGLVRFSFFFETSEEFKNIQNIIYDFRQKVEEREIPEEYRNIFLLYAGMFDTYESFIERVSYYWNLAIFIETENNKKFGIFIDELITPDKDKGLEIDSDKIFLYSFETKKQYDYIGNGKKVFRLNKEGKMIIVGDNELIIYDEFFANGGEINFPMKSFDFSTVNNNVLTGQNGKFLIKTIEVFCFSQLMFLSNNYISK